MKKNYNQPIVEIESAMFACQAICTSPGPSISGGGNTEDTGSTMYTD